MLGCPLDMRFRTAISFRTCVRVRRCERETGDGTHHVLSALHEFLVDDLAGIVLAGLDVDSLFDDGVGAGAKSLAGAVLEAGCQWPVENADLRSALGMVGAPFNQVHSVVEHPRPQSNDALTWQGTVTPGAIAGIDNGGGGSGLDFVAGGAWAVGREMDGLNRR